MTKFKTLLLTSTVLGGTLLGGGCIPVSLDRLFNIWDFGISAAATLAGTNLIGGIIPGLGT